MSQVEHIPKTYEEAVMTLARWGGEAGADDLRIFAAEEMGDNVVRLIHVTEQFPDSEEVSVYTFGASEEFPFQSALALATPEQWEAIRSLGERRGLPSVWRTANAHQVWPPPNRAV